MSGSVALPPASPPILAGPAPMPAAATATLSGAAEVLAALAALGRSTNVSGTVLAASDGSAPAQLLTALGIVDIETPMSLAAGAVVTLQPSPDQPGTVIIVSVDGVPTRGPATRLDAAQPAPLAADTPPTIVALGTVVSAIVVADAAPAILETAALPPAAESADPAPALAAEAVALAAAASTPAVLGKGEIADATSPAIMVAVPADTVPASDFLSPGLLLLQEVAAAPAAPPAAAAPVPETSPPATPEESAPAIGIVDADHPLAEPFLTAQPRLLSGTTLALRILAAQPPAPGSSMALGPAILSGTIRRFDRGMATLETAAGPLTLTPAPRLPLGTSVTLRLVARGPSAMMEVATRVDEARQGPAAARPSAGPPVAEAVPATKRAAPPDTEETALSASAADAPSAAKEAHEPPAAIATKPETASTPSPAAEARLYRVALAAGPIEEPARAARPHAIVGTVLAEPTEPAPRATLLATPLGRLAIMPRLALPAGTLLLLAVPDPVLDAAPADPSHPAQENWPALHAALGALGHAAPDLTHQLRADLAAGAGEKLAAALLLVVAALRGDTRVAWPGVDIDRALALAGHGDIATQLASDIGTLRQIAADPATAPWQVFLLPVVDGPAIRPLRLYVKQRGANSRRNPRQQEENARFILEFELSRIGALQLDGFVRPRRFDLVLRSRAPLAQPLRGEVTRIFHDRIAAAGIAGEIEFATSARFEVAPLEARRRPVGLAV